MPKVLAASIYEDYKKLGGQKILVTRLWPRGVRKTAVSKWMKELAPSYELLRRFKDGKIPWSRFRGEYLSGLKKPEARDQLRELKTLASKKAVTIFCVCRNEKRCHRSLLRKKLS